MPPEEQVAREGERERGKESLMGCPEGPLEEDDVCRTKAGTEADEEDEDGDVVGGVEEVGFSVYESEGFTLWEYFVEKDLQRRVCLR